MWYYESLANQWPAPPWATDSQRFATCTVITVQFLHCTIINRNPYSERFPYRTCFSRFDLALPFLRTAANQWPKEAQVFKGNDCLLHPVPSYNSNCTKERSSSTSQVPATIAVPGWIWLWYNLICSRDWVESTQSETLDLKAPCGRWLARRCCGGK